MLKVGDIVEFWIPEEIDKKGEYDIHPLYPSTDNLYTLIDNHSTFTITKINVCTSCGCQPKRNCPGCIQLDGKHNIHSVRCYGYGPNGTPIVLRKASNAIWTRPKKINLRFEGIVKK